METFKNKLVAVLNKNIEPGKLMNALAHMTIGLGASLDQNELHFSHYHDANEGIHPFISNIPFIVLTTNTSKIRNLRQELINNKISYTDFTDTMTIGTYKEQLAKTLITKESDLIYYGIVIFGSWNKVSELTRKFSLWK